MGLELLVAAGVGGVAGIALGRFLAARHTGELEQEWSMQLEARDLAIRGSRARFRRLQAALAESERQVEELRRRAAAGARSQQGAAT